MQTINAKKLFSWLVIVFLFCLPAFSQQSPVDALKKYYEGYPEEKIYIWFDKTAYVAGETIWFKAYLFSGYEQSFISTSLFVEFYDAQKKLISTKLLPVISGVSQGSIDIDSKTNEGVYFIRAYTKWMLNFNDKFQYIQPLLIYNPASEKKLTPDRSVWKVAAIPEGGTLISGLETKVAVRLYAGGLPGSKWSGYVYEESDPQVKIKEFNALDENVGSFSFTPEARKKYLVYVKDETGNYKICPLPLVKSSGVSLSVENNGDSVIYRLRFKDVPGNGNGYQVVGEIQHQLVHHASLRRTTEELMMKISAPELNNGILHLTVFDPSMQVAAERLIFLNPGKPDFDSSVINQQTISFQARAGNKLLLKVDSVNWISYGIVVTDASSALPREQENILSALWLTTDLANPVQNAAAYFDHPGKDKINALDALLISERWTRFNWNDIINNKYPQIRYIPDSYLSYTGRITRGNKLKPNEDVNLILSFRDSSTQFLQAKSDSAGNIFIDNVFFTSEAKVFYQLNSKKYAAKLIDINFERNNKFVAYAQAFPELPYRLQAKTTDENQPAFVQRAGNTISMEKDIQDKYKTLQEVVVKSKIKTATEKLNEQLSSGLFSSNNEIVFDFVNDQQNAMGYYNILQWLQGRVAGLSINIENGESIPYIRGTPASLYLDETRVDPGMISSVNVSDIALIKVIKGPFALMTGSGGGTIAIYTARGNMRPAQREPSLPNSKIKGYDAMKKFFTPYYDIKSVPQPDTDTRDLLLWQSIISPNIEIDKGRVVFFNNDSARRYRVIIQGVTEKGVPVYVERIIEAGQKAF